MKNGFSLIELMITIAVIAIAASVAAPTFTTTINNNRLASQTNAMVGALSYVRTEAVKRNDASIAICASSNQSDCDTDRWELGWIVFRDINGDGARGANEELLRVGDPMSGGNWIRVVGFPANNILEFDTQGQITNSGTFVFCDFRGDDEARAIIVTIGGKSRRGTDDDNPENSIVNDHNGADVSCA